MELAEFMQSAAERLLKEGSIVLSVRVHPRAKQTSFKEVMADGSIKIAIRSAPEGGKANEELVEFLSELFQIPPSQISVLTGTTVRRKQIRIAMA